MHMFDNIIKKSLTGSAPLLFLALSVIAGAVALYFTPREEEPQIVVPIVDIVLEAPGLSAQQVERQITIPLEKLLSEIPGIENIYSTSHTSQSVITLRFYVGENREESLLNTYNKLYSNQSQLPPVLKNWSINPVEVDDIPVSMLALWSSSSNSHSDFELRRVAEEVSTYIQTIDDSSEVNIVGGRPRTIRILPNPESLAARQSTPLDIVFALQVSNQLQKSGNWILEAKSYQLESGDFIRSVEELKHTIINVVDGQPVFLQDVADIIDGPAEPDQYTWIDFSTRHPDFNPEKNNFPMVVISVAKQRGSNAVSVTQDIQALIQKLEKDVLPTNMHVEVLRDYGQTANEKVNNLTSSLLFAIMTVVVFIAVFLGWRPALVVGIAIPISYGVTLALDMAFGYSINRVTLFALILSLGLLVDDPITGVDNIKRYLSKTGHSLKEKIVAAMSEIKTPLLMSTLTIILAFVPLAFITGMMGPYMAPMAFNVPVSVATSTLVAFIVTPWLGAKILRKPKDHPTNTETESLLLHYYRRALTPILNSPKKAKLTLWLVLALFFVAATLPMLRMVPLKLLPFDNKNEIQVLIDMPEYASLEQTAAVAETASHLIREMNETLAVATFVGTPSPIDFNGMVRSYYRRTAAHFADLRVTLVDKTERHHQSSGIVLRLREKLAPLNQNGVLVKVVQVPPGPPVLSTLVAEIYGSILTPYSQLEQAAENVMQRLSAEPFVVEIDSSIEAPHERIRFVTDKAKAALSGVSTENINLTLQIANQGYIPGYMQFENEANPLPLEMRLPFHERTSLNDLKRLHIKGLPGITQQSSLNGLDSAPQPLVALGELGDFQTLPADGVIHRKDLRPVVYVTAELSGRTPAEVIADVHSDFNAETPKETPWNSRTFLNSGGGKSWSVKDDIEVVWTGEGEWKITVDVFRDMGIAFAFALTAIFFVLKIQTTSVSLSLIIMSAIPLTIIGIMPGFWILNQLGEREIAGAPEPVLFTATAMIGMIALAGIVVRNSLILVEFITQARGQGLSIKEALIQAGATRARPILLTAGTTLLGNLVIILDPVFSGLALAIIFGIISSTAFTLLVIPIVYMLVFDKQQKKHRDLNKMNNSKNKTIIPLLSVAFLFLTVAWMSGIFSEKIPPGSTPAKLIEPQHTVEVIQKEHVIYETVPASIEAKQATVISSRILARIKKVHVRAGDMIEKGQLMIELEDEDLQSRVSQANSRIESVTAQLNEAKASLERARNLSTQKLIANADLDKAQAAHDALLAEQASAQQVLSEATTSLAFARVVAPISGRIVDRLAEPGDTAQPGVPLLSLYNPFSLRVEANVREKLALSLNQGQSLNVIIPSLNKPLEAELEELVPFGNTGSRSFLVKGRLLESQQLLPGMYAQIKIPAGKKSTLLIPKSYIAQLGQLDMVWILDQQRTERRLVRAGKELDNGFIEIISGLQAGDKVIPVPTISQR